MELDKVIVFVGKETTHYYRFGDTLLRRISGAGGCRWDEKKTWSFHWTSMPSGSFDYLEAYHQLRGND